jgi:hypothetical protein
VLDQLDLVLPAYIEHIKASKPKEVEAAQTLSALVGAYLRPN